MDDKVSSFVSLFSFSLYYLPGYVFFFCKYFLSIKKHGDRSWNNWTGPSNLWRTIKAIDSKSPPKTENEAMNFDDSQVSSPKQIVNYFNRLFTTSRLGRHTSSHDTQIVSREIIDFSGDIHNGPSYKRNK